MAYETDERLKNYLDTNQMHREQMCLAVLAIDRRFSNVRPRHPRGGPDGARDIEATLNGVQRVFGAVGFVNQANDSDEHKKKAGKKFNEDLTEALKQDSKPEVFIFFTNVNLTVGEKDDLVAHAKSKGLASAEVFDRERIRLSLDNADGLGTRFQYLGIPLSQAEQATFFARWGDDIQAVIADGFGRLERSLNRIQFLQESTLYLRGLTAVLELDREYAGSEIGHFRAFARMHLKGPVHGIFGFIFGATDISSRIQATRVEDLANQRPGIRESMCGGQWELRVPENLFGQTAEPDQEKRDADPESVFKLERAGSFTSVGQDAVKTVRIHYNHDMFIRLMPQLQLQDIDDCMFLFYVNRSLAHKVKAIHIFANEYKLTELSAQGFRVVDARQKIEIPLLFSDSELADDWVLLAPPVASSFHIRFSEETPKRFFPANEVTDSVI